MNSHLDLGLLEPFRGHLDVPDVQVAAALARVGGRALDGRCRGELRAALCVRAYEPVRCAWICAPTRRCEHPMMSNRLPLPWPDPLLDIERGRSPCLWPTRA